MMETASSDMQASGQEVDTIPQPTQPVVIPAPPQATPQPTPLPPPQQVIPQPNPLPPPPPVIPQPTPLPHASSNTSSSTFYARL